MSDPTCPGCKERDERIKELEARALRMERALRTIEAWPFNIMGDCVADARALARKALEEADDDE